MVKHKNDYKATEYKNYPHSRYRCQTCNDTSVVVGYEVESVICTDCDSAMVWDADLYEPER